ncbi:hypothetical protein Ahy_B03g064886 [Arachis hypogaea]|uniref:SWIM-type domain-containing protein n=1 Tax=Arachis hypogaea TaxID=3818 RepID=A0A445A0L1_ARAHY|nr:hypothetical protein Ahy_B03g064886 [Arachis hypogaea]
MDDSTSDCQLNQGEVDYEFESNKVPEPLSVVDDQFVPKVGMTFTTLEDAEKFYRNYAKAAENNEEAGIRPSKTYQSFVAAVGGHRELNFIEKDVRNYITREVRNVSEQEDAKEFGKYFKDSFDSNWNDFLLNFGLVDNKWLSDLYEDRHIWVPIYLDHHFWAGMRSTQRSESMHSFFNKFITRNSSLIQFVKQYDNCLGSTEQAERESDAADFHTVISCYSVYEVGEQVFSSIFNKFVVTYDSVAAEVKCQCLLFESRGILCRHALSMLSFEQELTAILHCAYNNVMVEMKSLKAKRKGTSSLSHEDANLESVNELQSPPRIRTRGRPKNRLGSKLDKQIANFTKKKKTKGLNELNLFDAASVVHSNSSQYQGHVMNYQFRVPAVADNSLGV